MADNLRVLKVILAALIPSTVLMFVLFAIFPYTGLARIITVPQTYFMNLIVIGLGVLAVRLLKNRHTAWIWGIVVFLTLVITVWVYPQESKPHIVYQTWDWIRGR
ncbi:hypothetical protein QWJ34_26930 [Saccharibacillus sp. CPCC 101409]|uniref:hypothetical protein n=1 Tax=Saccharibacillus sp. CPCC 101409 TaxID=3058041 RepID=UPI002671F9EF|nr:hypothetical protein [Saccharibacillus sp. CPCC 101409]MDO3413413.1 hypothetical protein [Saccharibacillus sp. CPCC 101409]